MRFAKQTTEPPHSRIACYSENRSERGEVGKNVGYAKQGRPQERDWMTTKESTEITKQTPTPIISEQGMVKQNFQKEGGL